MLVIDYSSSARDVPSSTPTARCQTKRTSFSFFHTPPTPSATPSRLSSYSSSLSPALFPLFYFQPTGSSLRSLHRSLLFRSLPPFSLSLFFSFDTRRKRPLYTMDVRTLRLILPLLLAIGTASTGRES